MHVTTAKTARHKTDRRQNRPFSACDSSVHGKVVFPPYPRRLPRIMYSLSEYHMKLAGTLQVTLPIHLPCQTRTTLEKLRRAGKWRSLCRVWEQQRMSG